MYNSEESDTGGAGTATASEEEEPLENEEGSAQERLFPAAGAGCVL